jgi:protocatechuate 3,4-dioxygenase beta subunit
MKRRTILVAACALPVALGAARAFAAAREPVLGGACEGCDWVFDDLPAAPGTRARIAGASEPGVPLVIEGVVTSSRGRPVPDVIVYAYHTDHTGIYPAARNRHGRLRGWARTNALGRYRFDTIRPAPYPGREIPEHVHMHVIEPGVGTYYIDSLEFLDDPLLTRRHTAGRGGIGLAMPGQRDGVWYAQRDVVLGRNIPGHPG